MREAVIFGELRDALACYNDFKASDRNRFPFNGGRLDQPDWALHNLDTLALADEWIALGRELGRSRSSLSVWDEYDLSALEDMNDTIQQDDAPTAL